MKKILTAVVAVMLLTGLALGQTSYNPPTVVAGATTAITWTAGTVNNGGHPVTIAAGSGTVSLNETSCAPPTYSACNIVFANSSGTVAVTTSIATAAATGDVILAYVETGASTTTQVIAGWQNGTAWSTPGTTAGNGAAVAIKLCGTTVTCAVTVVGNAIMAYGTAALTSGSPSTASLTALPFTSNTSYVCTASPEGTSAAIAAAGIAVNQTSGSATTLTGPNTVTTVVHFTCIGT